MRIDAKQGERNIFHELKEKVTSESLTPGATSENINQIDDRIKLDQE